jgi:hypothetical protein
MIQYGKFLQLAYDDLQPQKQPRLTEPDVKRIIEPFYLKGKKGYQPGDPGWNAPNLASQGFTLYQQDYKRKKKG